MTRYAPIILRLGLSAVLVWFGSQQLLAPADWVSFLPAWTSALPISQTTFVSINGWLEVSFGLLLAVGFYTRAVAAVLAVHLAGIVATVGYNPVGVRDFGLTLALVSTFLHGPDNWSLDRYLEKSMLGLGLDSERR